MASRGAYGVRIDGKDRVLFNFRDSQPDTFGLRFAREAEDLAADPEALAAKVRAARLVDPRAIPSPAERAQWGAPEETPSNWLDLTQGDWGRLAPFLDVGVVPDRQAFLLDGLMCEYAYIINLDTGNFEVYEGGFNRPGRGRYGQHVEHHHELLGASYYGVHLVAELPLRGVAAAMKVHVKLDLIAGR